MEPTGDRVRIAVLFLQSPYNLPTQIESQDTGKSTQKIGSHKTYFFPQNPTEPAKHQDEYKVHQPSQYFPPLILIAVTHAPLGRLDTFWLPPALEGEEGPLHYVSDCRVNKLTENMTFGGPIPKVMRYTFHLDPSA